MEVVDVAEKFSKFSEHWRPKLVAELNGQEVKVVKFQGEFVWHKHDVDEMFFVWRGEMTLEFRDRSVSLCEGQMIVVPSGVEHRPVAESEVEVLLFEPAGVRNTGDVLDDGKTAGDVERICVSGYEVRGFGGHCERE